MLEKFRKKFGENSDSVSSDAPVPRIPDKVGDTLDHNRELALRNRHRAIGAIAFILLLLVVLPWIFEPNVVYSDRGAKTTIPPLAKQKNVKRLNIEPKKVTQELRAAEQAKKSEAVAKSLAKPNVIPEPKKSQPVTPVAAKPAVAVKETTVAKSAPVDVMGAKIKHLEKDSTAPKKPAEVTVRSKKKAVSAPAVTSAAEPMPVASPTGRYYIQVIATSNKASAELRAKRVRQLKLPVYLETVRRRNADLWRVRVGKFEKQAEAKRVVEVLRKHAIDNGGVMLEKPQKK